MKQMMKRLFSLALVLVLLCGTIALADDDMTTIKGSLKSGVKLKKSYADNPVIEGVSSTTGLPASGEVYTPILVVLDNAEAAYPHWGVSEADIIFQIPNAGSGATKLLALFADHYPQTAGGVRSARASMVPIAMAWDAAFSFAGGPEVELARANPMSLMKSWKMSTTNRSHNLLKGAPGQRESYVISPHNLSCMVADIHKSLVDKGVKFEQRPFLFTDEPRTDGKSAQFVEVLHYGEKTKNGSNPASAATFTYDPDQNAYYRTNSTGDYEDRLTGEVLYFANVIVMRTKIGWKGNYPFLNEHLVGSGSAEIFQNGQYVSGAWKRSKQTERIVFVGPDGKELPMQRGKTFIVVTNQVTGVSYK